MHTHDSDVLAFALAACAAPTRAWLVTIVATSGSSPRPAGAMLACTDTGTQAGSVSGGCVEEDLIERLRAGEFDAQRVQRIRYGVSAEENARLGLPCGGQLDLIVQSLRADDSEWLQALLDAIGERRCIQRQVRLADGHTVLQPLAHFADLEVDTIQLAQSFGPRYRMLLVGAGQLAASLAELALAMDYEVLVTDPRPDTLAQWTGPEVPRLPGMPDDVVRAQAADRFSVVITLTHDPRIDDMALMEALESEAWYVGALGSKRTTEKRLQRLQALDIPQEKIDRLQAPVGLDIGSKTPLEIAVAIMAQLVQLRRRPAGAV
ncbi:XdhC family protein [Chromatocurvus halotolerans]|uniref:Xanthine dehydrogenase accessory factor n=1 Tax=Chromatocurvus halotolerans TaxID=1132028 RepID=A0A4R2L291_9GAMM|nr:XdhC family protein [Chromatocurvus halotolerans]TCO76678.1 xanthine dehydrogenase accessory factor [Chromatocurvus halotolerans]